MYAGQRGHGGEGRLGHVGRHTQVNMAHRVAAGVAVVPGVAVPAEEVLDAQHGRVAVGPERGVVAAGGGRAGEQVGHQVEAVCRDVRYEQVGDDLRVRPRAGVYLHVLDVV